MDTSKFPPQLLTKINSFPNRGEWLWEFKYDGWRILAFCGFKSKARLITRKGNDYTQRFRSIANDLDTWLRGREVILDGELLPEDLVYVVFDILFLDGEDLRNLPLIERKSVLAQFFGNPAPSSSIALCEFLQAPRGYLEQGFINLCHAGHEGMVGKLKQSKYSGKRDGAWVKIKCCQ